jgi:hypothetical protein
MRWGRLAALVDGPLRGHTRRYRALALVLAASLAGSQCVFQELAVEPVPTRAPVTVETPVKAHLKDGSTVVYENGVRVESEALVGPGMRHDLSLRRSERVERVPLADVAAMETYRTRVKAAESTIATLLATGAIALGTMALAVAIFGSCPTVYSTSGGGETLEAETFSYSIAPLLEARDLDRLHAAADAEGRVRLEVRNEALETHYINHLQLLEVSHAPGELVVPDASGRAVTVGDLRAPVQARDRAGRDARSWLAAADGVAFASAPALLAGARLDDLEDWLDVSVPVPEHADRVALVLRARSSLLNTVLFYDVMMARSGARALDWLGADLARIGDAVELGRWVRKRLGLRVQHWRDGEFKEVARVPDPGPIAWRDSSVVLPVVPGERVARLRLRFLADAWRIDRLRVAGRVSEAEPRSVPLAQVRGGGGTSEPDALAGLREADGRYLETRPGQRFSAVFDAGPTREARERTFLLSSQGYYTEWVRGDWLRASGHEAFVPSDEALLLAMRRWERRKASFERDFEHNRVPVL